MNLYIIRNKKTGEWLSAVDEHGKIRRRGHTHAILCNNGIPRLFVSERGAQYALKAWLSGKISVRQSLDFNGNDYEEWNVSPDKSRKENEMEIRKCRVQLT